MRNFVEDGRMNTICEKIRSNKKLLLLEQP